jgi:DNA-directed RNA polymerase subunit H (RpoH/RPB5)
MVSAVWENVVKMYQYRGGECDTRQDPQDVPARLAQQKYITAEGTTRNGRLICVIIGETEVNKKLITTIMDSVGRQKPDECLLIFSGTPSSFVRTFLDGEARRKYNYRFLDCNREIFCMELPKHMSVSPHRIATREEISLIESAYCPVGNLPVILEKDPMAIWIGARRGDVVMISRLSETAGEAIAARMCR